MSPPLIRRSAQIILIVFVSRRRLDHSLASRTRFAKLSGAFRPRQRHRIQEIALKRINSAPHNFINALIRALALAILFFSVAGSLPAQDSPSTQAPEKPGEVARKDLLSQF